MCEESVQRKKPRQPFRSQNSEQINILKKIYIYYIIFQTLKKYIEKKKNIYIYNKKNAIYPLIYFLSILFSQAASHRDRHISKLAITSLHDIMTELLSNRSELPHFWFHEALFKPFDGILSSPSCSEDDQEQVNNVKKSSLCFQAVIKGRKYPFFRWREVM